MKLSAYIIAVDSGFSPNPFGRHCTLACCKPIIRRNAEPGDVVIATGAKRSGLGGRLVYAMRVAEVLPLELYWDRYPSKRPSSKSEIAKRGDNIWHRTGRGWQLVRNRSHTERHRTRDLSGLNALVGREFYYFGRDAIAIPNRFRGLLATTQGHKNTKDLAEVDRFWKWLSLTHRRRGRIGLPARFDEAGCRAQRAAR